jgi:AcrR family transcriptional regulator
MATQFRGKDQFYWTVLNTAVTLDISRGHLSWKMADLARSSKVSRTLIYYYFGKSKEGILREAVRLFGDEISGATAEKTALWAEGKIAEAFDQSRELLNKIPAIVPFYLLNRSKTSEIGATIRAQERAFFEKIKAYFPNLSQAEQKGLYSLFFGAAFVPEFEYADSSEGIKWILKALALK